MCILSLANYTVSLSKKCTFGQKVFDIFISIQNGTFSNFEIGQKLQVSFMLGFMDRTVV